MRTRRGLSMTQTVLVALLGVAGTYWVYDANTCSGDGSCETKVCSSSSPCYFDAGPVRVECVIGTMCTNVGQVCEEHLFGPPCTCTTVVGTREGSCRAVCDWSSDGDVEGS